jgi:NADH-quinone oxidoreductase subunit K
MHLAYPAVLAVLLFCTGLYGVLARRNAILVLMSVELMLNAVNLNLVAFDVWLGDRLHSGQVLTLFVIVIAAAEVGLGLAIILALFRNRRTVDIDHLRDLAEPADDPSPEHPNTTEAGQRPMAEVGQRLDPGQVASDNPAQGSEHPRNHGEAKANGASAAQKAGAQQVGTGERAEGQQPERGGTL